jgi:hypothetical protein
MNPTNQSIGISINQTINQSINQSIRQSINQSINQLINQSIQQAISQAINRAIQSMITVLPIIVPCSISEYTLLISSSDVVVSCTFTNPLALKSNASIMSCLVPTMDPRIVRRLITKSNMGVSKLPAGNPQHTILPTADVLMD